MIEPVLPTPLPKLAEKFSGLISPVYRFFDRIYGSRYNPLYRSGTLAIGFFAVLLITGTYLSLFYSVSAPYASVRNLDNQIFLGKWIRALHRYATVACILSVFFHVVQLLAQGKTWGPRLLAWISGLVLTYVLLISAWTGYVMVWDTHGQLVAQAGARLLAIFPQLRELFDRSFNGTSALPPGFFFMNLFLHVALPLFMVFGLWVHTSRLSRAVWMPDRTIFYWSLGGLLAASILFPVPLLREADLLQLIGRIPVDISTGFWIHWLDSLGEWQVRILLTFCTMLIAIVPWWWKPPRDSTRHTSVVDEQRCTGCIQCAKDCPYEAITMVPRADGKRLIAHVNPNNCVSCGICAASCADFAIGPPGRSALNQSNRATDVSTSIRDSGLATELTILACSNNRELTEYLKNYCDDNTGVLFYPVECCGCTHSDVLEKLLGQSKGVALLGCPARNCLNRDGGELLAQRVFEKRVPFLDRSIDRARLLVTAFSGAELLDVTSQLQVFRARLNDGQVERSGAYHTWARRLKSLLCSSVVLGIVVLAAQWPSGKDIDWSVVRVSGLLPSFSPERCHPPYPEQLEGLPAHMRPKEICDRVPLQYELTVSVDNKVSSTQLLTEASNRVDRSLYLNVDTKIPPGSHYIHVLLTPIELGVRGIKSECFSSQVLSAGEVLLVEYNRELMQLVCRSAPTKE